MNFDCYRKPLITLSAALLLCCVGTSIANAENDNRQALTISSNVGSITTLDPHRAVYLGDKGPVSEIYNGLVRFKPGSANPQDIEADLASHWEVSADKKTWTFYLRHDVQFQKGFGELKASDVVYSLQRASDSKSSSFAANFQIIQDVKALDDYTVQITLKYPDAGFLGRVSDYHGGNIVSRKAAEQFGNEFGQNPIGTGPFEFVEHATQQYLRLKANDSYFRGKPAIKELTYRLINSDSARELAFSAGEIDLAAGKREQRWVERARQHGEKVDIINPAEYRTLFLNQSIKPLDNLKVRQAIAAAINVNEIIQFVGKDVVNKGCSSVPNGYLGEDCSAGTYAYDPNKAKALLSEAGYPDGFTLHSIVSSVSTQLPVMQVVQAQLAKVGINLQMSVVDHATYQAKSRKDQSAIVFYGAARFPNADVWLTEFYDSVHAIGAPQAMSNFSHCSVADDEIHAARIEPDESKQLALWKKAQVEIHDAVCGIPLFGLKQVWVQSDKLDFGYPLTGALNLQPKITWQTTLKSGE